MRILIAVLGLILSATSYAKSFSIMTYNAENLFDTKHDPGTTDWTYLPLAVKGRSAEAQRYCQSLSNEYYKRDCLTLDWNEEAVMAKITNLGRVVRSFDSTGKGPDIVVFEEVENQSVLELLVKKGLSDLGYKHVVLIEGDDTRGIDIGLISKYPVTRSLHHSIHLNGKKLDTRGILQVDINIEGLKVVVFGNHWPSQGNPVSHRLAAAEALVEVAKSQTADIVIATGDFNTIDTDSPHPFNLLRDFYDAEALARENNIPLNPGTHFYRGHWSSLDKIFVLKNGKYRQVWDGFQILIKPWMTEEVKQGRAPKRFDPKTRQGFSDHLPVSLAL